MLKFDSSWRYGSPGRLPSAAVGDFRAVIGRIATQADRQTVLEHFKRYFAEAGGVSSSWSSSASWAETDLEDYMQRAAENAPLFIEAMYDACLNLQTACSDMACPDVAIFNQILVDHNVGYRISPPNLLLVDGRDPMPAPMRVPSLDEKAHRIIDKAFSESDRLLAEGRSRQAVQELLWLLETVSTAFKGMDVGEGTVQGKYFNKIVGDLKKHSRGRTSHQVLQWIEILHGYLSSPTGGGVRHGTDLKSTVEIEDNEARLFCYLVRAYIGYLLSEHERLSSV